MLAIPASAVLQIDECGLRPKLTEISGVWPTLRTFCSGLPVVVLMMVLTLPVAAVCVVMKARLMIEMPTAGMCTVKLLSPLVSLGRIRLIVVVVLAPAGTRDTAVECVWCRLPRKMLARIRLPAQVRTAATRLRMTLTDRRSIPVSGVR